ATRQPSANGHIADGALAGDSSRAGTHATRDVLANRHRTDVPTGQDQAATLAGSSDQRSINGQTRNVAIFALDQPRITAVRPAVHIAGNVHRADAGIALDGGAAGSSAAQNSSANRYLAQGASGENAG